MRQLPLEGDRPVFFRDAPVVATKRVIGKPSGGLPEAKAAASPDIVIASPSGRRAIGPRKAGNYPGFGIIFGIDDEAAHTHRAILG